jgi:D-beta-D-heptose 7-phosphate kinase/D-beta-D-heptose 1-phosphate adenosyltransferase
MLTPDLSTEAAEHAPAPALYSRPFEFKAGTVFTNGCFDIFHAGHVDFLRQCRQLGSRLIVGINSDQSIRALKGPTRPICTLAERAAVVASCRFVDEAHAFNETTPCELIRRLRPQFIVKGPGYSPENMPEAEVVKEWDGQVIILDGPTISTTRIVQRICRSQSGDAVNAQ